MHPLKQLSTWIELPQYGVTVALAAGSKLGPFEIIASVGAGGMGEVYRARDTRLDRTVAIKILPSKLPASAESHQRFDREARAISALQHHSICTLYDVGHQAGIDFLVMEYLEGETLADRLLRDPIPISELLKIAIQIADALDAAHAAGIIHRDLKPSNIMLTKSGVKLLDFGLAKPLSVVVSAANGSEAASSSAALTISSPDQFASPLTMQGTIVGTIRYMSPEQVQGIPVDARTDVFSLGVVLYEALTGTLPFRGESVAETVSELLKRDPAPVTKLNPAIPARLEDVVARALEKQPELRYQSAADLRSDLLRIQRASESAQRLQPLPHPAAHKQQKLSAHRLIGAAVVLLTVATIMATVVVRKRSPVASPSVQSLAVLPLQNLSGNPDNEYLTDGITDELITDLAKLGTLRVISYTSVAQFKSTRKSLPEIASQLNVDAVIEGTVQISSNRIHVNAQMVQVQPEKDLWAESYDRSLGDALALQEELAKQIAGAIHASITPREKARLARRKLSPEAHDLYLKGRYFWNRRTEQGLTMAIEFFQRVITEDPNYAAAYSGLADSYNLLHFYGGVAPAQLIPKARAAARKAIELDDGLAEGHTSLAYVTHRYDWDWATAEREYKRALELNPNYATAHHWYAEYLMVMGRFTEAKEQLRQAKEVDPLSLEINTDEGLPFYFTRQYDRAIKEYREAIQMDPNFAAAHFALRDVYELEGAYADAISEFRTAVKVSGGDESAIAPLAQAFAQGGAQAYWRQRLELALRGPKMLRATPTQVANIYAALGDRKRALDWLEKGYQTRDDELVWLAVEPWHRNLRSAPEFADLMRRVGLAR